MLLSRTLRLALSGLAAALLAGAQVRLTGRVVDENDSPLARARITARRDLETLGETVSGPAGEFQLQLPAPGRYSLTVDRTGYFRLTDRPVDVGPEGADVTLVINTQREVFQSIDVGAASAPVDPDQTQNEQRLNGTEVNDVPYPNSHSLRNSMKLIPGVVQDPTGAVHFQGGAEYQTQYTLNGFDISNPISGRYSTRLAVEGVRSLDLLSSRESPQYGRGSAGTLQVQTDNGTDEFRYTATNFIPGVDSHGGLRVGGWTPRAALSGPIVRGRAWFSDSFDGEYNGGYLSGLPKGQDTNSVWAAGNLLHTQINVSPATILYADLLTNFDHQAHSGLGVLDPVPTTTAVSDNQWMAAVKGTHSWYGGAMLEAGFAWMRTFTQHVPMGDAPYRITPDGRSGNYFVRSRQEGRRRQAFLNYYPRPLHLAGRHQLMIGTEVQRLGYSARFRRTSVEVVGLSGRTLFQTSFRGPGAFEDSDWLEAAYISDHWQPMARLSVDAGLRQDWNELVGRIGLGPRIAASWTPFADTRTKITAGYALVRDTPYMALLSRPLDQQAATVTYSGGVPGAPLVTTFVRGHDLKLPRYDKWSAGIEREFPRRILGSVQWLKKRGRDGLVYSPESGARAGGTSMQGVLLGYGFGETYALGNKRRDAYDEVAFSARQSFGEQYGWMASYVRSRAVSNAVLDVSVDQPLQVMDNFGRMPWDAPNRLLAWGYLPLHGNWAWSFLADWRSGFPFAAVNEAGTVVGAVDSYRYPSAFDLNIAIERRFIFRGYRFAIRGGANNLTAHRNPTAVDNVIGSPRFLHFYGDEGRHFVLRLRFFGRAGH